MITELLNWWYFKGWGMVGVGLVRKLGNATDFFSLGLLFRTLFEPFKQISNTTIEGGSLEDRWKAFTDRLFSRIIGAIVRIGLICVGIIMIIIEALIGLALLIIWPMMPFLPIVSIIMAIIGVTL